METETLPKEPKETIKDKIEDLTDHIGTMAGLYYKLTVVKAADKATTISASVFAFFAFAIFGFFALIFGSFTLGLWLGDLLASRTLGFAIVTGFYLFLAIILVALRKRIVFPYIRNLIIRKFYD